MSRRTVATLALALGVLARAAAAQSPEAPVQLTGVAVQRQGKTLTVSITTSAAPKYRSELIDGPFRLVLDFEDARYRWKAAPVSVGSGPVRAIRGSQYRKDVARLVIELSRRVPYTLEPHARGVRVVFAPSGTAAPPATAQPATPPAPTPPAQPAPPRPTSGWLLQGIVIIDDTAVAYIADAAARSVKRYAVGDPIGDGRVESIEERHVVLRMPHARIELRLEEPRPRR